MFAFPSVSYIRSLYLFYITHYRAEDAVDKLIEVGRLEGDGSRVLKPCTTLALDLVGREGTRTMA